MPKRKYSDPIPGELLSLFATAQLVVADNDHSYTVYRSGEPTGMVWGPSVEDEWFVHPVDQDTRRVPTRDGALMTLIDLALSVTGPRSGTARP